MKILFLSVRDYERFYIRDEKQIADNKFEISELRLSMDTVALARGFEIISVFVGDDLSAPVLDALYAGGTRFVATRATGYDNIDINKTSELGMRIANVPDYSAYSIAEHALALLLALNRKLITANQQMQKGDYRIDRLMGFDIHGKTIGIIGTGRIGSTFARLLSGFDCRLIGYDTHPDKSLISSCKLTYLPLPELCRQSHIISLHTPLNEHTKYMIDERLLRQMKTSAILLNTSRGACINTKHLLTALTTGKIGAYGADVYEYEKGLFFYDHSKDAEKDELLISLLALPNVLITPHQGFLTQEAVKSIVDTTWKNINAWKQGSTPSAELVPEMLRA